MCITLFLIPLSGEETHVIPDILELREQWNQSAAAEILKLAGVTEAVLRKAIGAFMIEVIINHGPKARRFCDKDPLSLLWMEYIHEIFPNSKFILLLRDGRATVHSIITRQIPVARFDTTRPEVHYERLVLDSRTEMRKILQFIDVEWSEDVLHHEKFVEKYVKLSPGEYSSSQVRMPIHREALSNWFDFYSFDVRSRMHQLAPMLAKLGYNPYDNRPNYTDLLYKHSLRDRK
ncbi:Protein-tyrosine sulfotransferase 2 [Toxocara canis]|uniref:Protein-tyrosine sulfotransferase n=1 Tax=Toxocara canis TaxID=6265 RepID=A0A0B2VZT2_TOXCA|nr:Protein-tyrosine sulfotransferase 2 [Toxocara canis]